MLSSGILMRSCMCNMQLITPPHTRAQMSDADLTMLSLGTDVTNVGLNLNLTVLIKCVNKPLPTQHR